MYGIYDCHGRVAKQKETAVQTYTFVISNTDPTRDLSEVKEIRQSIQLPVRPNVGDDWYFEELAYPPACLKVLSVSYTIDPWSSWLDRLMGKHLKITVRFEHTARNFFCGPLIPWKKIWD